jgi:hypothetical protein
MTASIFDNVTTQDTNLFATNVTNAMTELKLDEAFNHAMTTGNSEVATQLTLIAAKHANDKYQSFCDEVLNNSTSKESFASIVYDVMDK